MANIYTIASTAMPFDYNRSMIGIFNNVGSGKVVKVHKIIALNNQTVALTGTIKLLTIQKLSTGSGGLPLIPVKHDSISPNIPSQITVAANMSFTVSSTLYVVPWSSDEPIRQAITLDELEIIPKYGELLYIPYSGAIQPITLREGQGISLTNISASNIGIADFFMEFILE